MRELICRALYGAVRLASALHDWITIAARLAEAPRRRQRQPERIAALLTTALP